MKEVLYFKIKNLLRTFPQVGISGQKTLRFVDEDVFLDGLEQILEIKK